MKPHLRARAEAFVPRAAMGTAHDGASPVANDMASWNPPLRSADADILPDLRPMVGRSRDLDRNNPIARGMRRTHTDNIIGSGLRLSARPAYAALKQTKEWAVEWGRQVETLWNSWWWTTACDARDMFCGDQLATLALAAEIMNGGSLTLPLWIPERGDGYATKLQGLEADRLSNPFAAPDSKSLRGGIAIDQYGAPVGYHIRKTHPGDFLVNGFSAMDDWAYVPRYTNDEFRRLRVIHAFDPERSEQTRGKPLLAAVIPHFKQMDRHTRAELDASVNNALIAMVLQTPLDRADIVEMFANRPDWYLQQRKDHAVRLGGGSIIAPFPGDTVQSFLPQRPNAQFSAFQEMILRIAGVALDLPYELVLKDFSKTTYTSGRMALLEAWRSFNRRRDWFGTMWMDPIYGLFVEELVNDGRIEAPGFYENRPLYLRCRWIGPGRGWVDPVKEAQGAQIRIDSFLSTYEDECAEQGRDWREVFEQQSIEKAERDRLGLPDLTALRAANPPRTAPEDQQQGGNQPGNGAPSRGNGGDQAAAHAFGNG